MIRPEVRALRAYEVADATGLIKLDAMENPYSWPPEIVSKWQQLLAVAPINRYPDPGASALRKVLRRRIGLADEFGLLLGNGSDEIIQMLMLALDRDCAVIAPTPTFVMYEMSAKTVGLPYVGVPLGPEFALDAGRVLEAAAAVRPGVIFIAYPNNPTGNLFAAEEIERIIRGTDALVVVDEAYFPFAGDTFIDRLQEFENLLVMRTLSKEGLAGLRLGFIAGHRLWIDEIDKVRLPYNINRLTQITVEFALEHSGMLAAQAEQIKVSRARLFEGLNAIPGIRAWPSDANFILFSTPGANEVFDGLRRRGILIKNLAGGGLPGFLRVTVGTAEENRSFLQALRDEMAPM
ncbi:MAG: histidinol-phosphate transaminase [Acidiferrobacteraceae bacterium]